MATQDARLSSVEARVEEHTRFIGDQRNLIVALAQKVDRRFEAVDRRFEAMDQKIEARFEAMERRFDQLDRRFMWVIGMQFSTLLTIITLLLRRS